MANKKWAEPNVADPLSEPAFNRRMWAAYLAAGFTRAQFARALDARDALVWGWDTGKTTMTLPYAIKAAALVGYTLDELAHGHAASTPTSASKRLPLDTPLTHEAVRALLHEIGAREDAIRALGEYDATPDGRYQPLTPTFVRAFIRTYLAARDDDGLSHALALSRAIGEATNARAHAKAFEERRRPDGAAAAPSPKRKRKGALRIPVGKPTAR